jgi:hypothetical protein
MEIPGACGRDIQHQQDLTPIHSAPKNRFSIYSKYKINIQYTNKEQRKAVNYHCVLRTLAGRKIQEGAICVMVNETATSPFILQAALKQEHVPRSQLQA